MPIRRSGRMAAVVAAAGLALVLGGAAHAADVYPRPADGALTIAGHGNGHGHGMSQYGALGAARAGKAWQEIVAFYYPGTATGGIGNPTIRVRVASLGSAIQALPAQGLRITWDLKNSSVLPSTKSGQTVSRWRIVPDAKVSGTKTKFVLQYQVTGSSTWNFYARASVPSTGAFLNPTSGVVDTFRGSSRVQYRGQVRGVLIGSPGGETLVPVVGLPMESYLRTVVPSEVPASWPDAALRAQAVAARSFAEWHRTNAPVSPSWYDVYDDTRSQVFKPTKQDGTVNEYAATNAAVSGTAGTAVLYKGKAAFTQFSASSGGWTSDGGQPYLVAKRDDWDGVAGNPYHAWTGTVRVSAIESAFPAIGRFRRLDITQRNGLGALGGRVLSATIIGSKGSVTRTGAELRSVFGNSWSDWFKPTFESASSFPRDVTSDGRADIIAVVRDTGALRVYAGDGNGGATTLIPEASGWTAYAKVLTAGTWDADDTIDLLVQDQSGDLLLRKGRGNGTFAPGVRIGKGWQAANLVIPVGDFNGDGVTDLVVRMIDGNLFLYPGNGTGGFKARSQIGKGWEVVSTAFSPGDFTGDGIPDLLYTTRTGELWLYPGNGHGKFKPKTRIGGGWTIYDEVFSPGDFDGNGRGDILARRKADGGLYLYSGNGAGRASPARRIGGGWQIFSTILK